MEHGVADVSRTTLDALKPLTPAEERIIADLAVMVGFAQKYVKDAGIGTIVALMLPYTMVLLVVWTLMLIVWNLLGIPLGPG